MARPEKKGLDYFPLDVDFLQDRKMRRITRLHGTLGLAVIINLYCKIYHENGYYLLWDEDICYDICEEVNTETPLQVQTVVDSCLQVGLFSAELYEHHRILTSAAVQRRFLLCSARRTSVCIAAAFNLISTPSATGSNEKPANRAEVQQVIFSEATDIEFQQAETPLMQTETPQTKTKETEKKEKQKEENLPPTPSKNKGDSETMTIEKLKSFFSLPDYALNKKTHNYEGLLERLYSIGVHSREDLDGILRLSRYGEIGHPVWSIIVNGRWAGEKKPINAPGKYIIKVLLNLLKTPKP
ncbi:DUF4373 domain-containing protein [uncultured Bacteroides sp.]|uniref:DUF4373 domain-containing protein n=1 Tax=uncultured Bacteroides sp. TaxID=162156 RepID=UPI002AA6A740|nr:DUF4373 domain-containing protein [uncultured Bacteroides sp.]